MPDINDISDSLQGSKIFTLIDLKDGYYHIEVNESDKEKTAFEIDNIKYEFNRMLK